MEKVYMYLITPSPTPPLQRERERERVRERERERSKSNVRRYCKCLTCKKRTQLTRYDSCQVVNRPGDVGLQWRVSTPTNWMVFVQNTHTSNYNTPHITGKHRFCQIVWKTRFLKTNKHSGSQTAGSATSYYVDDLKGRQARSFADLNKFLSLSNVCLFSLPSNLTFIIRSIAMLLLVCV